MSRKNVNVNIAIVIMLSLSPGLLLSLYLHRFTEFSRSSDGGVFIPIIGEKPAL